MAKKVGNITMVPAALLASGVFVEKKQPVVGIHPEFLKTNVEFECRNAPGHGNSKILIPENWPVGNNIPRS